MNERKNIPYRFFWNWDQSTNWCLNTLGEQNCGVGNPYLKRGDFFEKDFCRMIDWCADWQKIPAYAREIARIQAGITGDEQLRRWQYLANFLQSFYWEGRLNGDTWDVGVKRGGGDRPDE